MIAWDNVTFAPRSRVHNSVVATEATVGSNTTVDNASVIGDHAHTGSNNHLSHGLRLQPNTTLPDNAITF